MRKHEGDETVEKRASNFHNWHLMDLARCPTGVRFRVQSGSWILGPRGTLLIHSGQRRPSNISCAAHFPTHWTGSLRRVNFYFDVRGQSL